jgi:hypothetical protein
MVFGTPNNILSSSFETFQAFYKESFYKTQRTVWMRFRINGKHLRQRLKRVHFISNFE